MSRETYAGEGADMGDERNRTLLAVLVARSDRTHEEHVTAFNQLARSMSEPATLSLRQFERWLAGELVTMPRPTARRVAEAYWGRPMQELLGLPLGAPSRITGHQVDGATAEAVNNGEEEDAERRADGSPLLRELRRQLLTTEPVDEPRPLQAVRVQAVAVHTAYQRADYHTATRMLPDVLRQAEAHILGGGGRQAQAVLAVTNLAASKLAVKLGDASLAWITADRAYRAATTAEHGELGAAASYSIACALAAMGNRQGEAAAVVTAALDHGGRHGGSGRERLSVRGALVLLAAVIAARQGRTADVERDLDAAAQLADRVGGDHNDVWTGFGPTNVVIHRVGVAARHRPDQAIRLGERLDASRMPAALVGRRAQVHLDLATAYAHQPNGDPSAVLHLLEAERLAPQLPRCHPRSRRLISELLRRERRTATPGLRQMAARVGLER